MIIQKYPVLSIFIAGCLSISSCMHDEDEGSDKIQDCSVSARCESGEDLAIRLRQVETFYYETVDEETTSFLDLAQFDYDAKNRWIGGVTRRVAESDFDYIISYDNQGRMSQSNRFYYDDQGNEAEVTLDYFYVGDFLDRSESNSILRDEFGDLIKTIDETIDYSFQNNQLVDIAFDVIDSQSGMSDFHYTFSYDGGGNLLKIQIIDQSNGRPDYTFKLFTYQNGKVVKSKSYRQLSSGDALEQEVATYEYFVDGPIKQKTAIINASPKQKVETVYKWEAGACAFNQTYGDRLFPTPEIENFPCF